MKKTERIIFSMLVSIIFYLQSILALLLWNYVSWFWLEGYMWISAIIAGVIFIFTLVDAKFGG